MTVQDIINLLAYGNAHDFNPTGALIFTDIGILYDEYNPNDEEPTPNSETLTKKVVGLIHLENYIAIITE